MNKTVILKEAMGRFGPCFSLQSCGQYGLCVMTRYSITGSLTMILFSCWYWQGYVHGWERSTQISLTLHQIYGYHIKVLCIGRMGKAIELHCYLWNPPDDQTLKWNVDGYSKGKPGPAGIGGVLRDHLGIVKRYLLLFSG